MVERRCGTCKCFKLQINVEPCRSCDAFPNYNHWEPKVTPTKREEKEIKEQMKTAQVSKLSWSERSMLEYLKETATGGANAVKARHLKDVFIGISDKDIRKIVNSLRRQGFAICSDGRGYFYAQTIYDTVATVRQMKSRIDAIQAAITGMESNVL